MRMLEQRFLLSELVDQTLEVFDTALEPPIFQTQEIQSIEEALSLDLRPLQRPPEPFQFELSTCWLFDRVAHAVMGFNRV